MKLSAIVAAALISVVSAQTASKPIISVTAPLAGASYKAGDKAIISWINPTVDTISQIVLAKGASTALQPVTTIASNVKASAGTYEWAIPADTPPGSDYAFEFGTSPDMAFTGQFSITAGTGGGGSSNSSSSASGGASGSSSASASGAPKPSGSSSSSASGGSASSSSGASSGSSSGASSGASGSASASGSSSGASASASSAANSLTVGSVAAAGAAMVAVAQLF